ncbi:hypothetical protein [Flavobacterium lindanitolerans]|uniref:hypothetical protein n=1 Tax=Flavobacterium lindanitolerans TaxID=428988 RepID=UPI0031E32321
MHSINKINIDHISRLDETQLGELLQRLLYQEAITFDLQDPEISVPQNTKSKDGGVDGTIAVKGAVPSTPRLCNKITAFQNKATDLTPKKCYEEILLPKKKGENPKLKPAVEKIVEANGSYILFTTQASTPQMINDRVTNFRAAIKDAGHSNHDTMDIKVFDANTIKDWTNEYMSAVDLVQSFVGITKPVGSRDWKTTGIDINAEGIAFQIDSKVSQHIQMIRDNIIPQKVIRIIGHSGIGKTRLVFEAFRPEDDQSKKLNAEFLYCDIGVEGRFERLDNYITSHRHTQSGIIVVDNCDAGRHNHLSNLIKSQGNFKLITLGFDDNKSVDDVKIRIDRQNQRDLVRQIVKQQIGYTHLPQDIDYVARLSEGYPWMAVRYCETINQNGISGFDKFFEDQAIEKLVFGVRPVDKSELNVLRACSVFSAFGFVDDSFANIINENYRASLNAQTEFIRTVVCDEVVTASRFREICLRFKEEDIIEQRGVYYIVKPTVLAIQLAAKWLTITPIDKIKHIIENLKKKELEQKFLDRLTDLDQLDKARDIVEELFGMNSSFGSAEVLKTEWGSLLFRYVVEVNPEITCQTLENAFSSWTRQELMQLTDARRNLVWALEKLCFHKETFFNATKFLFKLAVSENESWANNATGQVTQLFQRFLAGTEADYKERIDVLRWALNQDDHEYTKLAISCMAKTFIPEGHHHRSGGAENQGSGKPLVDYMPETWDSIFEYWESIFDLLLPIINSSSENSQYALKVLSRAVRTLVAENAADLLFKNLKAVVKRDGVAWIDIRTELQKALKYDSTLEKVSDGILEILEEFKPKTLEEKFLAFVSLPEWTFNPREMSDGQYVDRQESMAEDFAIELTNDTIDWLIQVPSLLEGEQRQAYTFGHKIGEIDQKAKQIVKEALSALKKINIEHQNPGFIMGLISGINEPDFYEEMLQMFINDPTLNIYAVNLSKLHTFKLNNLLQLFELVDSGRYKVTVLDNFRFGKSLAYLSPQELETFIDKIAEYGIEGKATAFSILFMHCFQDEANWKAHSEMIRQLIISENLLLFKGRSLEPFYWATAVENLLNGMDDKDFAMQISIQISVFCNHQNFRYGFDTYLNKISSILFEQYFSVSWPVISEILNQDYLTMMHAKSLWGTKNGNNSKEGILFKNPNNYDQIYQWAETNERGRLAIANMMPFTSALHMMDAEQGNKTSKNDIHPFAKGFIDRFGDQPKVMEELSANLGSFGTIGGSEWYFQLLMNLVEELSEHPKREVRDWAKKAYNYYEKSLKLEKLENQTRQIE